jgi:hypothetical protein
MSDADRRSLLSAAAGAIAVANLSGLAEARSNGDEQETTLAANRPDLQVLNNSPAETEVEISLAAGDKSARILHRTLAARGATDVSSGPQSVTTDIPGSGGRVYTVQARVDGELAAERKLGLPPGGVPDHMSIFVDISDRRTAILYSEV